MSGAKGAPPCERMEAILEELPVALKDKVRVVKVNWGENPRLTKQYGIQGTPALLISKDGNVTPVLGLFNGKIINGFVDEEPETDFDSNTEILNWIFRKWKESIRAD
ncbi:thioredoxin family protein [Rhizobium leguminosarum]|uniref:thioredoxin family protein n=1 Tax=Rhizobium leguminosarum TaxID=384 RepID=UPI00247AFB7A|nr:thioredoxin family protein [Rhizobium leguminosarum]